MSQLSPSALSLLSSPQFWNAGRRSSRGTEETPGGAAGPLDAGEISSTSPRVTGWHATHAFLARHAFYPLALCTLLCLAFWLVRVVLTRTLTYDFLIKNLFLAWVPYFLSLAIVRAHEHATCGRQGKTRGQQGKTCGQQGRTPRGAWKRIVLWAAWLLMLPNAPYLFTDLIHWRNRPQIMPWWFDLGLVLTFGLAGCFAGVVSLRMMHDVVRRAFGVVTGWCFVAVVALLSGFGIYLGRFERWNSWDILFQPHRLLMRTIYKSFNPYLIDRTLGVTLMFGAMTFVIYVMFVSMSRAGSPLTSRTAAR